MTSDETRILPKALTYLGIPVLITLLEIIALVAEVLNPPNNPQLMTQPIQEIFVIVVISGPVGEEFIFRMVLIGCISLGLSIILPCIHRINLDPYGNNFPSITCRRGESQIVLYRLIEGGLLLLISLLFSCYHLLMWGEQTFLYYFIKGVIYGFLFLRYGLHSSLLMHIMNNFLGLILDKSNIPSLFSYLTLIVLYFGLSLLFESRFLIPYITRIENFVTEHLRLLFMVILYFIFEILTYWLLIDFHDFISVTGAFFLVFLLIFFVIIVDRGKRSRSFLRGVMRRILSLPD